MDKRETSAIFRARLEETIAASGLARGVFAARAAVDRSTLSQLLSPESVRLPRADTVAALAAVARVSVDWLLGLAEERSPGADVVDESVAIEYGAGSPRDARLARWHVEAAGYKIRYVPVTLPDLLKSEGVIRYEYRSQTTPAREQIDQTEERLAYSRLPETDMEACSSLQSVEGFARGEGAWAGLPAAARREQLALMAERLDDLYPTFRWFLYDGRRRFSAPYTVFGPQRAAVYLGDLYLAFSSTEHVRALAHHFDALIREAVLQPPEVIARVRALSRGTP